MVLAKGSGLGGFGGCFQVGGFAVLSLGFLRC